MLAAWRNQKPSPYALLIPSVLALSGAMLSAVPMEQWFMLYLCRRFPPAHIQEYLPKAPSGFWLFPKGLFESPVVFPEADWATCSADAGVQQLTAKWTMIVMTIAMLPTLITGPIAGSLSDVWGRKPLFLIPIAMIVVNYLSFILSSVTGLGLWFIVVVGFLVGCTGGFAPIGIAANGYIADTTDATGRTSAFIYLGAAQTLAVCIGPYLGGLLTTVVSNTDQIFMITIAAELLSFFYMLLFVPESLQSARDRADARQSLAAAGTPSAVGSDVDADEAATQTSSSNGDDDALSPLLAGSPPRSHYSGSSNPNHAHHAANTGAQAASKARLSFRDVVARQMQVTLENTRQLFSEKHGRSFYLMVAIICLFGAAYEARSVMFYYASYRFGWDALTEGQYMLTKNVAQLGYMLLVFPLLKYTFRSLRSTPTGRIKFDISLSITGLVVSATMVLCTAFAWESWMFFAFGVIEKFNMLGVSALRGLVSVSIRNERQGQLAACIELGQAIVGLAIGLLYPLIWSWTVGTAWPNLFLIVSSGFILVALGLSLFIRSSEIRLPDQDGDERDEEVDV
ncbi:major facilitator superfamily domain-containing protein [Entophlyctis helioformis]|nr:major facilitator superfamily domain-containing protein [Entophlyctis helioformis]